MASAIKNGSGALFFAKKSIGHGNNKCACAHGILCGARALKTAESA